MDTLQHCPFRSPFPRTSRHLPSGLAVLYFSRRGSGAFPDPDVTGAGAARTVAGEGETGAIARTGAAQTGTQPHESQSAGGWELQKIGGQLIKIYEIDHGKSWLIMVNHQTLTYFSLFKWS